MTTSVQPDQPPSAPREKATADYVFYELTRSICPECRRAVDAQVILRAGKVYMRKRCPDHGEFESLVYGDAEAYVRNARFNKPGSIPLEFATEVVEGCPHDCGLCPDHQQHACVGIIEVNSACNMDCPLCFANAGPGFNLTLEEVESILDHFVAAEGRPDVVQFSGGEPTIHPEIIPMIEAAQARGIPHVMINTNGRRIANDDEFVRRARRGQTVHLLPVRRLRGRDVPRHPGRDRPPPREAARARSTGGDRAARRAGARD